MKKATVALDDATTAINDSSDNCSNRRIARALTMMMMRQQLRAIISLLVAILQIS
jgi:hypothetical protein